MTTPSDVSRKHESRVALGALAPAIALAIAVWLSIGVMLASSEPKTASESDRASLAQTGGALSQDTLLRLWLDDYRIDREAFDANIQLQCAAILAGLLLILRRSDTLQFLGNEVPLRWVHVALPAGLLYLWLHFGFLLDDLIEKRIMVATWSKETANDENVSVRSLFWDSGFIDGWFVNFVDVGKDNYSGIRPGAPLQSGIFLMALMGCLVAASHAVLLGVTVVGVRRYVLASDRVWKAIYWGVPAILFAFLALSHHLFAYGGENRNSVQLVVAAVAPILLLGLLWLSVKVDQAGGHIHSLRRTVWTKGAASFRERASSESTNHARGAGEPLRLALIGDSLSTSFAARGRFRMALDVRLAWRPNWFVGSSRRRSADTVDPSIHGTLAAEVPVASLHFGTTGAHVLRPPGQSAVLDTLLGVRHLSDQVSDLIHSGFRPRIVCLWIGHNDVDWRSAFGRTRPRAIEDEVVHQRALAFAECYERELVRLLDHFAKESLTPVVLVFGLIHFEAFFAARHEAEAHVSLKKYKHFKTCHRLFDSMRPTYRYGMLRLAAEYNARLQLMCAKLSSGGTRVHYSDAFSQAPIDKARYLSDIDAWHPSKSGHQLLAERALTALIPHIGAEGFRLTSHRLE